MTPTERTQAFRSLPEPMRAEITSLINSYGISNKTQKKLEGIFGLNTEKK